MRRQLRKNRMSRAAGLILILACCSLACRGKTPTPNVAAKDIEARILGIKQAGETRDRAALPGLVASLDDEDPAVRLFAIAALEKFTGDRFGYEYYLDEEQRKPALAHWRDWLKQQEQPLQQPQPASDQQQQSSRTP
jgi:hypothetical protein